MDSATRHVPSFAELTRKPTRSMVWADGQLGSHRLGAKYVVRHQRPDGRREVFRFAAGDLDGYVLEGQGVPSHVGGVTLKRGQPWN